MSATFTDLTIRPATVADVDILATMAVTFLSEPPLNAFWRVDEASVRAFVMGLLTGETTTAFVAETDEQVVGMIGAAIFTHPFSGELTGQEIGWWMSHDARGSRVSLKLLQQAEGWARARGAKVFQVQTPTPRIGAFYERIGYALCELSYQKRIV